MPVYVSDRLTATLGVVRGSPTPTRLIQWFRGSTVIAGANASTYTITSDDLGQPISVRQTETNYFGSAVATSAATEDVEVFSPSTLFALNEPGVWYDPTDAANLAWRRNLLLWTDQFDNAAWVKVATTATVNTVTATASTSTHRVNQVIAAAPTTAVTFWVEAAAGTHSFIQIYNTGATGYFANFDLTLGVVGSVGVRSTASIVSLGSGRFRCIVTFDASVAFSTTFPVGLVTSASAAFNESWAAAGTETVSLFLAQLELGSTATTYQRITDLNTEVIAQFPNATLYQNSIGSIPVYAPEQPVGLMLDKSRGLVLGPELVTNGDFSNPVPTGWVAQGSTTPATISVVSGELNINTAAGNNFPGAAYAFTTVVGRTYRVLLTARTAISPNGCSVYIRDSGGNYITTTPSIGTNNTAYNFVFVARQTSSNIFVFEFTGSNGTGTIFVDNVSVKELPGNHATQSTDISRPLYGIVPQSGRRNLLTFTEQFNEGTAWTLAQVTITANAVTAPDGTLTADRIVETVTTNSFSIAQSITALSPAGKTYTVSTYAKKDTRDYVTLGITDVSSGSLYAVAVFNLNLGTVSTSGSAGTGYSVVASSISSVGDGWYRCVVTAVAGTSVSFLRAAIGISSAGTISVGAGGFQVYLGSSTSGIFAWGAQLEESSTATAYQKVTNTYDVTEAGVASVGYLRFDGTNDFMVSSTITPGTDKAQVFAGVRKLSDAAIGMLLESSPILNSNAGSLYILAPNTAAANYGFSSKGTLPVGGAVVTASGYAAPITNVLTGLGDISGDLSTLRLNGTQVAQATTDQGTGNFLAYPLYLGYRNSTANLFFNGQMFPLIVRFGPNMSSALIRTTENWVASKTAGVTLP